MLVAAVYLAESVTLAALAGVLHNTWPRWVKGAAFGGSFGDGENKAKEGCVKQEMEVEKEEAKNATA